MKKGVMYVICGVAGLAVIGGVAMYLLLPESVDVAKAVPQDLTEYENAYDKATVNVTYYSDGYNAAVAENNKAQARLNAAQTAAGNYQNQYTDLQNNLNVIDINLALKAEILDIQTKQLESTAAMLETKLSGAESMKQTLKSETDSLANEIAALKGTISGCESQISRNNKMLDELRADGADHETEISALLAAIETAQAQKNAW